MVAADFLYENLVIVHVPLVGPNITILVVSPFHINSYGQYEAAQRDWRKPWLQSKGVRKSV
jgi:hypothetical protein